MFYERLKLLRTEKNLTQKDLAKIISVSPSTIAMWETNKREPGFEVIKRLAELFLVSTDYLLCNTDEKILTSEHIIIPNELKDVKVAFHRGEFEGLNQDEVDKLAEFARFIKSQRKGD